MLNLKILDSLTPIFAHSIPQGKELKNINLCQNQTVNFQLAFKLDTPNTPSKDFIAKIKSDIPVNLYYINNVPVIHTSTLKSSASAGLYPDILLPKSANPKLRNTPYPSEDYYAEINDDTLLRAYNDSWQGLWLAINEDQKNQKSGTYKITIELFDRRNKFLQSVCIDATVLAHKLPKQKFIYTNWVHYDCLSDLYNEPVFTDRYFEILKDYIKKATKNGMNMILLPAFTPPLDTGVNLERMTVQLVKIKKEKEKFKFDFSLLKKFIDVCKECGITHFEHAHFFTQWGAVSAPKIIVNENGKDKKMFGWKTKSTGKAYVSFLRQYITELKEFLKKENLNKKILFHISDEPEPHMLEGYAKARESIIDLLKGYMVGDAMSDVNLYKKGYCDLPITTTTYIHNFIGNCTNLWAYYTGLSSLEGGSSRVISVPREQNRIIGIQLYYYNIKGFLHWGYNNYYGQQSNFRFNPCLNPSGGFTLPGTSYMVYPAFDGTCYQSVRQKNFAEAICDIRLLTLLEKLKGKKECNKLIEKHFGIPRFDKSVDNAQTYTDFINDVFKMIKE